MRIGFSSWIVVAIALAVYPTDASARKWTDSSGRFTIEAEFVDFQNGTVRLKKEDGQVIGLPLARLSEADVTYVQERSQQEGDSTTQSKTKDNDRSPEKTAVFRVQLDPADAKLDINSRSGEDARLSYTCQGTGARRTVTVLNADKVQKIVLSVTRLHCESENREFACTPGTTQDVAFRLEAAHFRVTVSRSGLKRLHDPATVTVDELPPKKAEEGARRLDRTGKLIKKATVQAATLRPFALLQGSLEVETEAPSNDFVILVCTGSVDRVRELVDQHASEFLTPKEGTISVWQPGCRVSLVPGHVTSWERVGTRQVWGVTVGYGDGDLKDARVTPTKILADGVTVGYLDGKRKGVMVGPEFGTTHVVYYLLKRGAKEEDEQISESPTVEACFVDEYTAPIAGAVSLLADHRITVPIVDDSGRPRGQGTFDQIVLRPDGMELVAAGSNARVACSSDGTLLWGHNDHADTVALTADGERCLFASGNKVAICDSATGKLLGECELKDQPTRGRTDPMFEQCMIEAGTVQFTVDGKLALAGTRVQSRDNKDRELRERDFRVRIYATARGNETRRFPSTHTAPITCLALSPDGKKLLTGSQDHTVRLWDIARATELRVYRSRAPVHGLCWSADGLRFAAASGEIDHKLWDELQRKKAPIDASRIDCAVRVWDATSGDELCRLGDLPWIPERIALSSDGRVVAAENRIWEVDTGQLRFYVPGSGSPAGFTPDDRRLITVGQGVSFWRLP